MKTHTVTGGGGAQLHVVEAGNQNGRPILFIRCLAVLAPVESSAELDLADEYRLVVLDMRGHGVSDMPRDGYSDSKLWADDVDAVVRRLNLDGAVLSGWSYGPLVFLDYIRHYGEDRLGGLQFVGAVTKLGSEEAMSVLTPEFLSVVPEFLSTDAETTVRGLEGLLGLCFVRKPSTAELYLMLGYNVSVPPYVRQGLFSRSFHNDDLLPKIRKPVLLTHGAADAIVNPAVVDQHKAAMPHAQIHLMPNARLAAFWDDATGFNERLRGFCESL